MKRRLFSCINSKMFFKLVGFQEPRASMSTGSCGRFLLVGPRRRLRERAARKGCTKACETPQQTYATARVGEHRFENCSSCP